jgi:hypothetical protein
MDEALRGGERLFLFDPTAIYRRNYIICRLQALFWVAVGVLKLATPTVEPVFFYY